MKIESVLNVECSMFSNIKALVPSTVNLLMWLMDDTYLPQQEKVRQSLNADERRLTKESMPSITPSGIFSRRGKNYLLKHTGLIAIDIDGKDNNSYLDFPLLTTELSKCSNIAYCGKSVSGTGFWALIAIADSKRHEEYFEFLKEYFKSQNIIIDKACKDVGRLRFYSYDPNAYFNHKALPLEIDQNLANTKVNIPFKITYGREPITIWEQYNNTDHFLDLLLLHGWKIYGRRGAKIYFTRPGKLTGISAEYDNRKNVFYVFTSSSQFEANKGYCPFQIYATLEHDGNYKKAVQKLMG